MGNIQWPQLFSSS